MPTKTPTSSQLLATACLGRPVLEWIAERRSAVRSWRLIARDLYEATDGQVDVTGEALRKWMSEPAEVPS